MKMKMKNEINKQRKSEIFLRLSSFINYFKWYTVYYTQRMNQQNKIKIKRKSVQCTMYNEEVKRRLCYKNNR